MWLRNGKFFSCFMDLGKKSNGIFQVYSFSDIPHKKPKLAPLQERKMIDRFRLWAKGGDGGNGCSSVRRSRHVRRGRPDGGNGGRGGDVILESSPSVWDFSSLQHHINAKRGGHGASKNMIGSRGADKVVQVPVGTVIHLVEGEIPSVIQKPSSADLDPWDSPGTLDFGLSGSTSQSFSTTASRFKSEKTNRTSRTVEEAAVSTETLCSSSVRSPHRVSTSTDRFASQLEASNIRKEEGSGDWSDNVTSGTEFEEDMEEKEEIQFEVAELTEPGQRIIIARGGDGGLGNVSYAKAPKTRDRDADIDSEVSDDDERASLSAGLPGSEAVLVLELKSIADVGLVGMPNAGKSTLLGAMSRAKPTVGHYAFTTLRPNLGKLNYDEFSVTVADIPGLIRGAHENRGLGHAFLRHIERTKVLAYVLDLAAAVDGRKGIPPWEQLRDLVLELESYREGLSSRPCLVVANKIDEPGAEEVYEELKQRVSGVPVFPVCAVLEEGIPELKDGLRMLVNGGDSSKLKIDDILLD